MLVTVRWDPSQAGGDLSSCDEQGDGQAVLKELGLHARSVLKGLREQGAPA